METLNAVNQMSRIKDRLLEIAEDGKVCNDELEDFMKIKSVLDKLSQSVSNLQLWMDEQIAADTFANQSISDPIKP